VDWKLRGCPEIGDGVSRRPVLLAESAAKTGKSFARIALSSAGVVTALSDPLGQGAVPSPADCSILPGFRLLTGRWNALFTRGRSICFWAAPPD